MLECLLCCRRPAETGWLVKPCKSAQFIEEGIPIMDDSKWVYIVFGESFQVIPLFTSQEAHLIFNFLCVSAQSRKYKFIKF